MKLIRADECVVRRPPVPNAPTVEVFVGGEPDGPAVGVVRVRVPAGAAMPEHDHAGSDVVLVSVAGRVEIGDGEESISVGPGDAVLVRQHERVSLRNAGDTDAELLVAAGPPAFVTAIRAWPAPDGD